MSIPEFRAMKEAERQRAAKVTESEEPPTKQPEYRLQISCKTWFSYRWPGTLAFHVPNGEKRTKAIGAKLKAMGAKKGVPDWLIDDPRGGHPGARIELKTGSNQLSEEQEEIMAQYEEMGYYIATCWNLDQFKRACERYMSLPPNY